MLMIIASFQQRCKCIYLPETKTWNSSWGFSQNETGLSSDISVSIRALDNRWYLNAPKGWKWRTRTSRELHAGEVEISGLENSRISLVQGNFSFAFDISEYQKEDTVFYKYAFPRKQIVDIGRGADNTICIDNHMVSDKHASIVRNADGSAVYEDRSTNGSYVNGKVLTRASHTCSFGDSIFIAPGFRMIYLGDLLAITKVSQLKNIRLLEMQVQDVSSDKQEQTATEAAIIDYQRAPRILEKPDKEEVEIEPPIAKSDNRNTPLILTIGPSMTMVFPMLVGSFVSQMSNGNGSNFMYSGIAMMGTSALLATAWGFANSKYRKKQEKISEKKRVTLYRNYIKEREKLLQGLNKKEYQRLNSMYVNAEGCLKMVSSVSDRLWERLPAHEDFLDVRVGVGAVELPNPLNIQKAKLSLIDDPLRNEPERLKNQYGMVENAPIRLSLRKEKIVGLLGRTSALSAAFSMIIHLAAMHSYNNLKIVILTEEKDYSQWQWARWLPHVFANENRTLRMVAAAPHAISEVLLHLDEVLSMRLNADDSEPRSESEDDEIDNPRELPLPHYVVFCTNQQMVKDEAVLRRIISSRPVGITLVSLASSMSDLPKECGQIINCRQKKSGIYDVKGDITPAKIEYASLPLASRFARNIAALRSYDNDGSAAIPMLVKFLNMYGARSVEELDIWRYWNENHAYDGLQATIGLRAGGAPFHLDISDRHHGPHGLVAGTTGSGKSVMLQSYILSLAINYSPKQVQFVLVDYKGGGMAAAFTDLPHVAGSIDNLQGIRTIRRALASIQGEIKRREKMFKDVGVSNIDEYIRFYNDEPGYDSLGHLIIIVDEFAELKKEQPEFMHELISASRVGRSVGVHLILATQKPSNSVDDEIWSNARFHICLRVQTRADSMDMLKRADAAYIRGMGRCFVQVGNDELFEEVQTSWSSAPYEPDKVDTDEKPYLLNDVGQPIVVRTAKKVNQEKKETQLEAIMKYMRVVADQHHVQNAKKLWLEELPRIIDLSTLYTRNGFNGMQWPEWKHEQISAYVGLADDLQNQLHIPVEIDLTAHRNHLIVGLSATGKTMFIQTLAMSLAQKYSPDKLHMYIISPSSRVLNCLRDLPHTGEVLFEDEEDEIIRLLYMLHAENQRRRKLFAAAATDNFIAYNRILRQTGHGSSVPAIVVFVDRFVQLDEMLNDEDKQLLYSLIKEASARGIYFVATALAVNEVYSRIRNSFFNVALQLHERSDYIDIIGKRLPSEMNDISPYPGRGVIVIDENIYEMQLALYNGSEIDTERSAAIIEQAAVMNKAWNGNKPQKVPRIPEKPVWKDLIQSAVEHQMLMPTKLAISYLKLDGLPYAADLAKQYAWLVAGAKQSGKTTFLTGIASQFVEQGAEIHIFGDANWKEFAEKNGATLYLQNNPEQMEAFAEALHCEIAKRSLLRKAQSTPEGIHNIYRQFKPYVIIIDDLAVQLSKLVPKLEALLVLCCSSAAEFGIYLFASVSTKSIPQIRNRELLQSLSATQNGLSLCGKLNENDLWDIQVNYATKGKIMPFGQAYLIDNGKVRHVVIPK